MSASPTFNLLDRGWIPCLRSSSDPPESLSIRQVFHQANTLQRLTDPAPTITAMLHRLLLAILHRSLNGPQNTAEWAAIWRAGMWDFAQVDAYLDCFRDRFDLFDPVHPFYQTTGLADKTLGEVNHLTHERASDRNRPLLFDHSLPGYGLSPDAAARYLIAQQGFSVGGMFSTNPGEGAAEKFAPSSPLLKSAICLATGKTLFETLMLNWYQYNRAAEEPFPFAGDDKPAWERDDPVKPVERRPDGWVDLLTWQCRRIALQPTVSADGSILVTHAALMQGYRLPQAFDVRQSETMVAFTELKNPTQSEKSPWIPVGLTPGKAAWRDSHALLQSFENNRKPTLRILGWLHKLIDEGKWSAPTTIPLSIFGIMPDQARIEDWRHETLALPPQYIEKPEIVSVIGQELDFAEHMARLLEPYSVSLPAYDRHKATKVSGPVRVLAEELLRATSDRKADPKAVAALGRHLIATESYWAALESPFRDFVIGLANTVQENEVGALIGYGDAALTWANAINHAARACFSETVDALESSGRSLRAVALARERFEQCRYRLNAAHEALLPPTNGGTDVSSQSY